MLSLKTKIAQTERQIVSAKQRVALLETHKENLAEELESIQLSPLIRRAAGFESGYIFRSEHEIDNSYAPSVNDEFDIELFSESGGDVSPHFILNRLLIPL